jgi:hypothetical protein
MLACGVVRLLWPRIAEVAEELVVPHPTPDASLEEL